MASQTVNGYVAAKVFKHALLVSPAGTGGCAIVVRRVGGWTQPDPVTSQEYPRLLIECYADPDRNTDGTKKVENGTDKAWALWRAVDAAIAAGRRDQWWGAGGDDSGLRIITCVRTGEPTAIGGPSSENVAADPVLGDMSKVQALYDIQTVH